MRISNKLKKNYLKRAFSQSKASIFLINVIESFKQIEKQIFQINIFSINIFDKFKQIKFLKLRTSCFAKSTMIKRNFNMSTQNIKTNVIQNFSFFNVSILKFANFLFSTILMKIISQLRKNFNNFSNLQCQKNNNNIFLNISMSYFNFA